MTTNQTPAWCTDSATHFALRESTLVIDGAIAEFTLQRPKARNPITQAVMDDLLDSIQRIEGDPRVRVLILAGSGGSFCAGGDVKAMRERLSNTDPDVRAPDFMRRRLDGMQKVLMRLRELDQPVIAAVDGPAYGAGFSLALQADFVLASTRASFNMSFARVGVLPDFGALNTLPRIVGLSRAREILMTARTLDVREGEALGFVHAVHDPERLYDEARAFARRLAVGPRESLAMTKRLLGRSFETDYATLAMLEASGQGLCLASQYHLDAVRRFLDGRAPEYDWDRLGGERDLSETAS